MDILLTLLLLAVALTFRLKYFVGINCNDDGAYLHEMSHIVQGTRTYVGGNVMSNRWGTIYPMAVMAKLFGPSEFTAASFSIFCSLLEISALLLIGKLIGAPLAGYFGSLLLALFPPHVILAGRTMPDAIVAASITLSVLLFVYGMKKLAAAEHWKHYVWFFFSGSAVALGYFAKETALFSALFYGPVALVYWVRERRFPWFAVILALTVGLYIYLEHLIHLAHGQGSLHRFEVIKWVYTYQGHNRNDLGFYLHYLFADDAIELRLGWNRLVLLIGILLSVANIRRGSWWLLVLIWLVMTALYLEFGIQNFTTFEPINKEYRYLSMLYAPAALLAGGGYAWLLQRLSRIGQAAGAVALFGGIFWFSLQVLPETRDRWLYQSPPCGSCTPAAKFTKAKLSAFPERLAYVPAGSTGLVMEYLSWADAGRDGKVIKRLEFFTDRGDPLPRRGEPFLMVIGLDRVVYRGPGMSEAELPPWISTPEQNWMLVDEFSTEQCIEQNTIRIYRVTPHESL